MVVLVLQLSSIDSSSRTALISDAAHMTEGSTATRRVQVESANEYEGSTQSGTQAREDTSGPRAEQEVLRMGSWNPMTSEEPSAPSRTQASMFGRAGRLTRWTATKVLSGTFSSGRSVPLAEPAGMQKSGLLL